MQIVINPGTEDLDAATPEDAADNMRQFLADLALPGARFRAMPRLDYEGGRYAFRLYYQGRRVEIQMPGWALEYVRYDNGANPWHFPRLYVDGSSWLWEFAINVARRGLVGDTDE